VADNRRVRESPALCFEVVGVLLQRQREIVDANIVIQRVERGKNDLAYGEAVAVEEFRKIPS
jgi:hypothetical protein